MPQIKTPTTEILDENTGNFSSILDEVQMDTDEIIDQLSPCLWDEEKVSSPFKAVITSDDEDFERETRHLVSFKTKGEALKQDDDMMNFEAQTWNQLLKMLTQESCQSLTGVVLNCTDVSGTKINVPNLKNIVLDLTMPAKTIEDILTLRSDFDLEPYLFFQNTTNSEESLFQLLASKINFELVINGVKFLDVNWKQQKLHIGFGGEKLCSSPKLSCLLSSQFLFNFTKLSLVDLNFPNYITNRVRFLTDLTLFEVRGLGVVLNPKTGTDGRARSALSSKLGLFLLPHLTTLNCWFKTTTKKTHLNLYHLSIGTELKRLSVHNGTIITPDNIVFSFKSLTELYSDSCHWDKDIIDNFNIIFPNLKKVSFSSPDNNMDFDETDEKSIGEDPDIDLPIKKAKKDKDKNIPTEKLFINHVTVGLMNNFLNIQSLAWIRVTCLKWPKLPYNKSCQSFANFLDEIGLRIRKKMGRKPSNFVLEKNNGWKILYDGESQQQPR